MSISDIKHELNSLKTVENTVFKKKNIQDILKNNIETMETYVNNRVINIYSRPWNKLEPRLKKKKMNEYLDVLLNNKTISLSEFNTILYKSNKDLDKTYQTDIIKKTKIVYDTELCELTKFDYTLYLQ
jgi:hypothetical protein